MLELDKTIRHLEEQLLLDEVRTSANILEKIIDPNFFEIGSSGKIYRYKSGDTFLPVNGKCYINNFSIRELAYSVILVTYEFHMVASKISKSKCTLRSSIWKQNEFGWKIIFHQSTPVLDS